jgi:ribonuclease J
MNKLMQRGAHVIYDAKEQVHVSGHASQEEMKLLINLVRPKYMIPVHGELRHLHAHAEIAHHLGIPEENIVVVENGTPIEFTADSLAVGERIPGGYVFVDGSGVGDVGPAVLRDREALARDGFIVVVVAVDRKTGELTEEVDIISRGFVYLRSADMLFAKVRSAVRDSVAQSHNGNREQNIQDAVSKLLYNETRRRPMVFTHVHEC